MKPAIAGAVALAALMMANPAQSALTVFQTFVGNVGVSSDGWGSTTNSGTVQAEVPVGSTVLGAWLYAPTYNGGTPTNVSLGGTSIAVGDFTGLGIPTAACCLIQAYRTDVTSLVKPVIEAGPGGIYNFAVTKSGNSSVGTDGLALVVAYSNPALPVATVGILDGNASVLGEVTTINFLNPLNPLDPNFFAEMRLGIGFSCCDQKSTVTVNGLTLTLNAGNNNDSADGFVSNGNLITVGGVGDPFSPANPSYAQDTERYNLVPFISPGDTAITIRTSNASRDDNIFLAVFHTSGIAGVNEQPPGPTPVFEPGSLALLGSGLFGLALMRRRRNG